MTGIHEAADTNLLFVFTDEQRIDTLAAYGNQHILMPELDRLASRSIVFDEPYCTQPVCTPSRGTLMTGLMPHAHGAYFNNVALPAECRCIPELLNPEMRTRYATGYIGKWHLGDEVFAQHGFDHWVSIETYSRYFSEGRDRSTPSDYQLFLDNMGFTAGPSSGYSRDFASRLPERYTKAAFVGTETCRFIRAHRNRPWLLAVNFLEPHMPFQSPRDTQYWPQDIPLPDNFDAVPGADQPAHLRALAARFREEGFEGQPLRDAADWRQLIARYWGLNSMVDTHVGRMLRTLEQTAQDRRTLVVFTSDHGDQMGSHQLLTKGVMYKESTRVPLIVHLPGQTNGGRVTGPVSHIDLLPTVLDAMGASDAAASLPGRSLLSACRDASSGAEVSGEGLASECVIEWNPPAGGAQAEPRLPTGPSARTLVTPDGERFTHYSTGEREFYDWSVDPGERMNLAGDPSAQVRIRELVNRIRQWQEMTSDTTAPAKERSV